MKDIETQKVSVVVPLKAYCYRLGPIKSRVSWMEQTLEIYRWVYNETLTMRKKAWKQEQRSISYYGTKRQIPIWKKDHPELSTVVLAPPILVAPPGIIETADGCLTHERGSPPFHGPSGFTTRPINRTVP